jgi:ABC-type transport system involved in multi-copper enzyme maturation permease subunit
MTAITVSPASHAKVTGVPPAYRQPQRVTQTRVIRAEWTKLRTQPSAWWAMAAAVVLVIGFGVGYSLLRVARPPHGAAAIASFDPAAISLSGVQLAQIAVGVLGVLLITGEYAAGLIRTTFAAVPRRLPVLWGKAVLVAGAVTAVSVPAALAAFIGGQSILSRQHLSVSLNQPGATRAVVGSALYLAVIALLGLGLGAALRNAAGGIAALFGLLYGLPLAAGFLPGSMAEDVSKFLPANAGQAVTVVQPDPSLLHPWTGFGVLCAYAAVLLGISAVRMRRGDA